MSDKEFIQRFKEISIVKICEENKVNYHNIINGRAGFDATNKVANGLAAQLKELLDKKQEPISIEFD